MQAYVCEALNRQYGLDGPEGSAALAQATKPEVDATDLQKAQVLARAEGKRADEQSIPLQKPNTTLARPKSPIPFGKTTDVRKP